MTTNKTKRNTMIAFAIIGLAILCLVVSMIATRDLTTGYAFASTACYDMNEFESYNYSNEIIEEYEKFEPFGDKKKNDEVHTLPGTRITNNSVFDFGTFTNVRYISNYNYFLINPQIPNTRYEPNTGDNSNGTCTTIAMHMLLGYHVYFSDRRLVPKTAANGTRFRHADFGNINYHPHFPRAHVGDQWLRNANGNIIYDNAGNRTLIRRGCERIGLDTNVYRDIFDRTRFSGFPLGGQAVGLVRDGAWRFLNTHTPANVRNNVSISSGTFSRSNVRSDIAAGRPVIVGVSDLFGRNFHVMVAFGYATLDGAEGYIVHYGHGPGTRHRWVPASWFGFQIRMNVTTPQNFVSTGRLFSRTGATTGVHEYAEFFCTTTQVTDIRPLFRTSPDGEGVSINGFVNNTNLNISHLTRM